MTSETHEARSEDATRALAREAARRLKGGDVVHLSGALGAGKTQFAKGLAEGLGLDPDEVRSPTFAFIDVHEGTGRGAGLGFIHVDLYRIGEAAELADLGLDELPGPGAIAAIEWPERLEGAANRPEEPRLRVRIDDLGNDRRRILMEWA
jgi:tRNA threonylcarbamoyl adenosine modification protein YjeE